MKTANVSKRLFAALLAVLMFIGMLPFGALSFTAQAAEVTGVSLASVPAVRGDVTSASGAFTLTSQSRFYIVSDTVLPVPHSVHMCRPHLPNLRLRANLSVQLCR